MKVVLLSIAVLFYSESHAQKSDTLKNDDIIKMYRSGLSNDIIIRKINTTENLKFDLNADQLVKLKTNKIPDTLIMVMLESNNNLSKTQISTNIITKPPIIPYTNKSNQELLSSIKELTDPGVYYQNSKTNEFVALSLNNSGTLKPTDILLSNLGGGSISYVFEGANALLSIEESMPTFYVKIASNVGQLQTAQLMIYFATVKGGKRLVKWTKLTVGYGSKNNKNAISPITTRINNSTYKYTLEKKLPRGNYFFAPKENPNNYFYEFDIK